MEHTVVPTTFKDSYRSRITIEYIVTAKVSITVSCASASAIGTIVIIGESIHRDVDIVPVEQEIQGPRATGCFFGVSNTISKGCYIRKLASIKESIVNSNHSLHTQ